MIPNRNIYGYGNPYNPDVMKDLDVIKRDMEDEMKKENPDKERLLELRQKEMMRGMELMTGTMNGRTYRGMIPW